MGKHRTPRRIGPQVRAALGTAVGVAVFGALTLSVSAADRHVGKFQPVPPMAVGSTGQPFHPGRDLPSPKPKPKAKAAPKAKPVAPPPAKRQPAPSVVPAADECED